MGAVFGLVGCGGFGGFDCRCGSGVGCSFLASIQCDSGCVAVDWFWLSWRFGVAFGSVGTLVCCVDAGIAACYWRGCGGGRCDCYFPGLD